MKKRIIVVEDSNADYMAMSHAFRKFSADVDLVRYESGETVLNYLENNITEGEVKSNTLTMILLDLNLPEMDGKTILNRLKNNVLLSLIPVVIFSSSANQRDILDCYRLGANSYIQKPYSYPEMESLIFDLGNFWINRCEFPDC